MAESLANSRADMHTIEAPELTVVVDALREGCLAFVESFARDGANIPSRDANHLNSLQKAASESCLAITEFLKAQN